MSMKNFKFTIIASGLDPESEDFEDRFFEAGCDDVLIGFQRGLITLDFSREATSLQDTIQAAIRDVRAAGANVEHVDVEGLSPLRQACVSKPS